MAIDPSVLCERSVLHIRCSAKHAVQHMHSLTDVFYTIGQNVHTLSSTPRLRLTDDLAESLFANSIASYILTSAGNIPVDRKTKDRQKLFAGTMDALSKGAAVALFPEGTSYTEPKIMQVKDGAAWAALEYSKWLKIDGHNGEAVTVVPAAIVYTDKSKYRSRVSVLGIVSVV